MTKEYLEIIKSIKQYLDENACKNLLISEIADRFSLSHNQLCSYFKVLYGIGPKQYLDKKKIELLTEIINSEADTKIAGYYAYKIGLNSESALCHFIRSKKK